MSPFPQVPPEGRSGPSTLALGGWIVAGLAVAALVWPRTRPAPAPAAPAVPAIPSGSAAPAAAAVQNPVPAPLAVASPAAASGSGLEEVVARGTAAVVVVETARGKGSAFFVSADTLVTNVHVVSGSSYVTIRKSSGETATAYVGATAADYDLALLKLASPVAGQTTLPLGSAATLRAGQEVLAIGSPLGLQNSVTRGIVSGLRQMGPVTVVQTDAAINPGNSGGPLLDRQGNAIGVNTFILNSGTGQSGSQGLNFAVAIDHVKALLEGRSPAEGALRADSSAGPVRATPSESDQQQLQGLNLYEARLVQLARAADTLDQTWARMLAVGFQGRVEGQFERGWYALWTDGALQGSVVRGYEGTMRQVRANAETIKRLCLSADEDARRAGVLPGHRRDLRRKYHLDCPGWGL